MRSSRLRKSTIFLLTMMMEVTVLGLLLVHASLSEEAQRAGLQEKAGVVTTLKLTDLCLFPKARYARHPSQAVHNSHGLRGAPNRLASRSFSIMGSPIAWRCC